MTEVTSVDEGAEFLQKIASETALLTAWRYLNKSNLESFGLSGITINEYSKDVDKRIGEMSKALLAGQYRFSKTRAALIPKDNGKLRPLQIPEIGDRIVLKSLAIAIETHLEPKLRKSKGVSFAYQKDVGIIDAMKRLIEYYKEGYTWVFEADIQNFFDEVDKNRLLNQLVFPNIPSHSLVRKLLEGALNVKVDASQLPKEKAKQFESLGNGIPQGNPLSPLFSNIYLESFDSYMINNKYKLIRYADDFIVMVKSEEEGNVCFAKASKFLEDELQLKLHPLGGKSKVILPKTTPVSFLSITFDGKHLFPSRKNVDRFKSRIDTLCHEDADSRTIIEILQRVRNALDGWVSAFFFTELEKYFEEVDSHINKQVYLSLHHKSWRFTREVRGKLKTKYRLGKQTSPDCLSDVQRKFSGIPFSKAIAQKRREDSESGVLKVISP